MKNPSPSQPILAFLEKEMVAAKGKSIGAFSLYWLYCQHTKLSPPYRTVSAKRFYRILQKHGYRRRHGERGSVYEDIQPAEGA
jgi:hypothetical protein